MGIIKKCEVCGQDATLTNDFVTHLVKQYQAKVKEADSQNVELRKYKALADKRKAVLIEARQAFKDAGFKPAVEEGCVKDSVADYVKALLKWSKDLEATRDSLREHNRQLTEALEKVDAAIDVWYERGRNRPTYGPPEQVRRAQEKVRAALKSAKEQK